uniref:Beta-lactamase n=1 Tax=uncultured bacterium A1Q1_fos_565 TaxID=1256585 RepID=L7VYU2_9BACT|nr:beta-lactamase [uncultured bacterium A1Q1_fos_565]
MMHLHRTRTVLLAALLALSPQRSVAESIPTPPKDALTLYAPKLTESDVSAYAKRALTDWQAPGMAVAVIHHGKVVALGAYGNRRMGDSAQVDIHTRFALASLTKTLTAATIGMLAEEGKIALRRPLKDTHPDLVFSDPVVTAQLTMLDILSHRSGISESADLLWTATGYDRKEVLRRLKDVPQESPFRSRFSYSNVLYALAGELAAKAEATTWESLIRQRIFVPAALHDAGFGVPSAPDGNIATPHALRNQVLTAITPRALDNIAPAAGVYASISDLANLLRAFTSDGQLDGKQVFSKTLIDAMMTPQTPVGLAQWQKALYPQSHFLLHGLGLMLQDYRGKLVAWNTGGIDGFSCTLALIPDEKLGLAVLTNVPFTGLPEAVVFSLLDHYLGSTGTDWNQARLALSKNSRARQAAAVQAQLGTQTSQKLELSAKQLVGTYVSALLGEAELRQDGSGLTLRIAKSLTGRLFPWQPTRLRMQFDDAELGVAPCDLELSPDGTVASFVLGEHGKFVRAAAK